VGYSTCKYTVTLKPGLGSLKVIENYTIYSGNHDFLLSSIVTIGVYRTVSEISCDFRRKSHENRQFFPPRVFYAPAGWVPLGIGCRRKGSKTRMMGLSDGGKSFKIGLAVLIQYRGV